VHEKGGRGVLNSLQRYVGLSDFGGSQVGQVSQLGENFQLPSNGGRSSKEDLKTDARELRKGEGVRWRGG